MTSKQMEQDLAKALKKTAPNDLQGEASPCCEERKGTVFPMTAKKTPAKIRRTLAAACLAAALLGGGSGLYLQANAVASVVSLDVNPSIELTLNRSEKVLTCTPVNEEAQAILADMDGGGDLKGLSSM